MIAKFKPMKYLHLLNKEEELKAIAMLSERGINYMVVHYQIEFFGTNLTVCDIETDDLEVEKEIMYTLFPWLD